jgi:hypothetical protein
MTGIYLKCDKCGKTLGGEEVTTKERGLHWGEWQTLKAAASQLGWTGPLTIESNEDRCPECSKNETPNVKVSGPEAALSPEGRAAGLEVNMATKDISDLQVVQAYAEMQRQMQRQMDATREPGLKFEHADEILERTTGQHPKVCERAMERACGRDLVEYGMWLRGGWLTDKGKALLTSNVELTGSRA